jgi:hypothetical protein
MVAPDLTTRAPQGVPTVISAGFALPHFACPRLPAAICEARVGAVLAIEASRLARHGCTVGMTPPRLPRRNHRQLR